MKKILILLICICSLLTSCSKKNTFGQENNILDWLCKTDDYVSDKMLEKILEAIESNNQSALMSLFSENAVNLLEEIIFSYLVVSFDF